MLLTLYANRSISCSVLADSTGCLWWQSTPAVMNPSRLHRSHSPSARCHTMRFTSAHRGEFNSFWYRLSLLIRLPFYTDRSPRKALQIVERFRVGLGFGLGLLLLRQSVLAFFNHGRSCWLVVRHAVDVHPPSPSPRSRTDACRCRRSGCSSDWPRCRACGGACA